MKLIGYLIVNTAALMITAYLVPGFSVDNFQAAIVAAIVIGVINTFLKPILSILTLPISIMSLGIFSIVLNVLLLMLAANLTPGFSVSGFMAALIGSLVLTLVGGFLNMLAK